MKLMDLIQKAISITKNDFSFNISMAVRRRKNNIDRSIMEAYVSLKHE